MLFTLKLVPKADFKKGLKGLKTKKEGNPPFLNVFVLISSLQES